MTILWLVLRITLFAVLALASFLGIAVGGRGLILIWIAAGLAFVGIFEPRFSWLALALYVAEEVAASGRGSHVGH